LKIEQPKSELFWDKILTVIEGGLIGQRLGKTTALSGLSKLDKTYFLLLICFLNFL
jgi:hypothetical protein